MIPADPSPTPPDEGGDAAARKGGGGSASGPQSLGDLAAEGIEIDILPDGTVRLHAQCQPGQDPAECAERLQFLVEALGIPMDGVETDVRPPPDS